MTIKTFSVTIKKTTWEEAIKSVGDIPASYDVWKVGDKYPLPKPGQHELVLVNGLESFDDALDYAKKNKLSPTSLYYIFTLNIDFKKELEMNYGYVVTTEECFFEGFQRACYVWWSRGRREADLGWVSSFGVPVDWFAFSRESSGNFEPLNTLPEELVINNVRYRKA